MELQSIAPSIHMWFVFAVVAVGVVMYALEKVSIEQTSLLIIAVLLVYFQLPINTSSFHIKPVDILSGFADPALITIMALLVIGRGIAMTGALEEPTSRIIAMLHSRPRRTLFLVFLVAFVISMFMNNTPVVVLFIPVLSAMAMHMRGSASRYMMPLSFICILAGMTTIIGSSTNILVSGALERTTGEQIGFFEPAIPGFFLAIIGVIYIVIAGKWLLPARTLIQNEREHSGQQYIAPILITENHPLLGRKPVAGLFPDLRMMTVRMIERGDKRLLPPFDSALEVGDVLTVSSTRKALTGLLSSHPEYLEGMLRIRGFDKTSPSSRMVISEAMVSPGSRMIGKTLEKAGFRRQTGCLVLGSQRRSHMVRDRMTNIELQSGDVLLLFGYVDKIEAMRDSHDVLLLDWATTELPDIRKANTARLIFFGVILLAASGALPILHASVIGATLMIATGCLNVRQAIRALDSRIYMLIGAAFAMGLAMERTGGAQYIAHYVVNGLQSYGPQVLLGGLFLLVAIMTNLLSNSATAILFAPIAISVGAETGIDPHIMVLTVLFAANCSFATPIAYQTNLLVMGPGHYKFKDFIRFGVPLILVIWLSYIFMLPYVFSL